MKISNLKIKNIKCFKEVEISFETASDNETVNDNGNASEDGNTNKSIKNWSLIVGDNGQGKTTILRCLALGLCDGSGASALLAELYGEFLRQGENKGSVEITLKDRQKKYEFKTEIKLRGNSETVSQTICKLNSSGNKTEVKETEESKIREKIFAVGYGSGRSITGTEDYIEYAVLDSVYSLFNYKHRLQNVELGMRRIKESSEKNFEVLNTSLKKILMLDDSDDIVLSGKGLFVKTQQWGEVSFNSLSDGYQSMTTAIMDFLSWRLLYESKNFDIKNTSGIFIIDEVEQHLHPKWQRNIIKILSEQFPNMQFIGSTHTPICVLGLNDLNTGTKLIKASYENSHSEVKSFDMKESYRGYRVDQILTSDIFDLTSARSKNIEQKLGEYRDIYLKNEDERTAQEKEKMKKIEQELKDLPMWDTLRDKRIREQLSHLIEQNQGTEHDKN